MSLKPPHHHHGEAFLRNHLPGPVMFPPPQRLLCLQVLQQRIRDRDCLGFLPFPLVLLRPLALVLILCVCVCVCVCIHSVRAGPDFASCKMH